MAKTRGPINSAELVLLTINYNDNDKSFNFKGAIEEKTQKDIKDDDFKVKNFIGIGKRVKASCEEGTFIDKVSGEIYKINQDSPLKIHFK